MARPKKTSKEKVAISPRWKLVISIAVLVHLAAVISAPFSLVSRGTSIAYPGQPPTTSPVAGGLFRVMEPYTTFMLLNFGYSYFAPAPGPSHIVEFTAETDSGKLEQEFPDLRRHWPRLYYHRHFMLAEFLTSQFAPELNENAPVEVQERLKQSRAFYLRLRASVENHLKKKLGASNVVLTRVLHDIPPLDVFLRGQRLDDSILRRRFQEKTGEFLRPGSTSDQGTLP